MKDILLLLVLLNARTTKVYSQPYEANSNGTCRNTTTEYLLDDDSNRCCKKCHPGQRLKDKCTETTDSVCEPCPAGQYIESFNYSPNCFACDRCKPHKGLQPGQNCSSDRKSKCVCQPGMYCILGFENPYCTECKKYKTCTVGFGVSKPGTANSDVKCKPCPDGTFSDKVSDRDPCQPHTNCSRSAVDRKGNATSDNVCVKPSELVSERVFTTASTTTNTVLATSDSKPPRGPTNPTPSISHLPPANSEAVFNSTKSPSPSPDSDSTLAAAIPTVIGSILLFIIIFLLCLHKPMCKKDAEKFYPTVDANGNVESGDKINQGYLDKTQLDSFTVTSPEQQCLLEKGEAYSEQSQSSNNTETLTRTNGCSSFESIDPLQSTIPLYNPCSALSQPMALLSNIEPVTPQPSVQTQSSSQPTSPQIISPVTTSPHVNVNITFHIGNGTCGTPSVLPTDLMQGESKLPFGEEEESFSIPQQEAGKQSLMSVQESESYSA